MRKEDWQGIECDQLPEAHRRLAEAIGVGPALKLSEMFGGEVIYIPKLDNVYARARARRILKEYDGLNTRSLARKYRISTRSVQRIVAEGLGAGDKA